MSDRFVVQVRRRIVGIAVRTATGFKFFASEPGFFGLEGTTHASLRAVILAAEAQAEAPEERPLSPSQARRAGSQRARTADPPPRSPPRPPARNRCATERVFALRRREASQGEQTCI